MAAVDGRIVLHLDLDCFYASVIEADQPTLKSRPLAIQQKQIVVTCNYEARRRGLYKLQRIQEARQVCPDLVIVLGEDLTRFRDVSKDLYLYLRSLVWGDRVEKLGFDELFFDVTDMVAYNVDVLNRNDLEHSFFHLDHQDPTAGFIYNATDFYGPTWPPVAQHQNPPDSDSLRMRLLVASHLAGHLRCQLESHKGYTATVGISTSKLLAKLVGKVHKPNSQTTLLPPYVVVEYGLDSNVIRFLDGHEIRKIPGIGSKIAHKLHAHLSRSMEDQLTVREVRLFPGMGPSLLDRILAGPGSSKGIGARIWGLIHGVDGSEVMEGSDLPTQISIEDSYGRLDRLDIVKSELIKLTVNLIRRMRTDLTEKKNPGTGNDAFRWRAQPRTLRLSTRPRRLPSNSNSNPDHSYYHRSSRSAPLPRYVLQNQDDRVEALAERLVREHVMTLFRRLHPEKSGWNLSLMNIAVTNMVEGAGEEKHRSGRDIGTMFQRQEEAVPPVPDPDPDPVPVPEDEPGWQEESDKEQQQQQQEEEESAIQCLICGGLIPCFALEAHELYHRYG